MDLFEMDHLILKSILPLEPRTALREKKLSKYTWALFYELIKRTLLIKDKMGISQ